MYVHLFGQYLLIVMGEDQMKFGSEIVESGVPLPSLIKSYYDFVNAYKVNCKNVAQTIDDNY